MDGHPYILLTWESPFQPQITSSKILPIGKDLEPIQVATQSNTENLNGEAARRDTETAQVRPATVPMSADYDDSVITYCHSWRTLSVTHRHLFACLSERIAFVSPLTFHYRELPVQSRIN